MSGAVSGAGGWFPVGKSDMELILTSAGERDGATLFTVWAAVLNLCNREKSLEVSLPVGLIAHVAGMGYKATLRALHTLSGMGMIEIEERRGTGKKNREPSLYRVKPSVSPCGDKTQRLGSKDTRVVAYNPPGETEISNKSLLHKETMEQTRSACAVVVPLPFDSEAFKTAWEEWQKFRREIGKGLKPTTVKKQLSFLGGLSEQQAIEAINQSVTQGWQGLFAPKEAAAPVKPERPIWKDCAARCRFWDAEKKWCKKHVQQEPKSCDHCREF